MCFCVRLIVEAIERAIKHCASQPSRTIRQKASAAPTTTQQAEKSEKPEKPASERPHDADGHDGAPLDQTDQPSDDPLTALKKALLSTYGTAEGAFAAWSNAKGSITKKEFKKMVGKLMPLRDDDAKALRKKLPKKASLAEFCAFVDGSAGDQATKKNSTTEAEASHLAVLPPEGRSDDCLAAV